MHTPEPARLGALLMGGMAPARALGRVPFTEHSFYLSAFHRASGNKAIEIIFEIRTKVIGIRSEQFRGMIEGMTHGRAQAH